MPELRWILILLGALLIAAVYFIGRRRQNPHSQRFEPHLTEEESEELRRPPVNVETEPLLDDAWPEPDGRESDVFDEPYEPEPPAARDIADEEPKPAPDTRPDEQKIIAVRVAARLNTRFREDDVVRLLNEEGLEFGKYDIFHRHADDAGSAPVFSVASMVEPGSFNLDAVDTDQLPGVTLFMVLPGPCDGVAALDDMLGTAQRLAGQLNGEVLDQSGSTLSRQRASNLRDEIIGFQHHLAVLQRHTPSDKGRRRFF